MNIRKCLVGSYSSLFESNASIRFRISPDFDTFLSLQYSDIFRLVILYLKKGCGNAIVVKYANEINNINILDTTQTLPILDLF